MRKADLAKGTCVVLYSLLHLSWCAPKAPSQVITDGLVGYWKFDEGEGLITADSSGYENHGTLVNGPSWTAGRFGAALNFDGIDDYVNVGTTSFDLDSELTISMWALSREDDTYREHMVSRGRYAYPFILQHLDGALRCILRTSTGTNYLDTASVLPWDSWYHIAMTYGSEVQIIYLDGDPLASRSTTGSLSDTTLVVDTTIGGLDSEECFNGVIDEVYIYNRALTQAEIQTIMDPSALTPTFTPSSTFTATATPTDTPSITPTSTPSHTFTDTPTNSPTNTTTHTPTRTQTQSPTETRTDTPTHTETDTSTNTYTRTPTDTTTDTPSETPTATPTATETYTETSTLTPTHTVTNSPTATFTDSPTSTSTNSATHTSTYTQTPSDTPAETPPDTPTAASTDTPSQTPTHSATSPSTATPADSSTNTPTDTPVSTNTPTSTSVCLEVHLRAPDDDQDLYILNGDEGDLIDFRIVMTTSDATGLGTYSQCISYDPLSIQYTDSYLNGLSSGLGQDPGLLVVNRNSQDTGLITVSGAGISGQSGPSILFELAFQVVQGMRIDTVTIYDNPDSTAPFHRADSSLIPHEHGDPVEFETVFDRDGDTIDNSLEGELAPGPPSANVSNGYLIDSDGDGLDDGSEDFNRNGQWETGMETRARSRDTDEDGWEDGLEVLLLLTDPVSASEPSEPMTDADQDGLPSHLDGDDADVDSDADRYMDLYEATWADGANLDFEVRPGLGDVNQDDACDNADAQLILTFFARELAPSFPFESSRSDLERNGTIDNADCQHALSFFGYSIPHLPVH